MGDFDKPVYGGETPLHTASRIGNAKILKVLLSFRVFDINKVDYSGHTALHVACLHGHQDVIKVLLAQGTHRNVPISKLAVATESKSADDEPADLSSKSTPEKIDPNIQDKHGKSCLHLGAGMADIGVVKALLGSSSVDINLRRNRVSRSHVCV